MTILFIDTETSGLPLEYGAKYTETKKYNSSRLLQISYIITDYSKKILVVRNNCVKKNKVDKSEFHKITSYISQECGLNLDNILNHLLLMINKYKVTLIVGHNIMFDLNILSSEAYRLMLETKSNMNKNTKQSLISKLFDIPHICTSMHAKDYTAILFNNSYNFKYPKLSELYYKCTGNDFKGAHDSLNDIIATAICFFHIIIDARCPKIMKDIYMKINTDVNNIPFNSTINNTDISDGIRNRKRILEFKYSNKCSINYYYCVMIKVLGESLKKKIVRKERLHTIDISKLNLTLETMQHIINFCMENRFRFIPKSITNFNDENYIFNIADERYTKTVSKVEILNMLRFAEYIGCKYLIDVITYNIIDK